MESALKIKPAEAPPKKARLTVRLPQPTITTFRTYLAAYREIYGVEPEPDFIANEILMEFFTSDRRFLEFIRKGNGEGVVIEGTGKHRTIKVLPQPNQPAAKGEGRRIAGAIRSDNATSSGTCADTGR